METILTGFFIAIAGVSVVVAFCGIGSALGIRYAAEAASAGMIENPKNFGRFIVLTALPGTQGIYGFIIGFLALNNPIFKSDMTIIQGLNLFFSIIPMTLAGFFSALYQGKVCAAGINMAIKHPDQSGKALVLGVFVEFYAILGLIISIFLLGKLK